MTKRYERMTKAQLIRELRKREHLEKEETALRRLVTDFEVFQDETRSQTQKLLAAQRLAEDSRDRYIDLYDFAPLTLATLDHQGVVREINLTGTTLLGLERTRIVGVPFVWWVAPTHWGPFINHLRECRQAKGNLVTCEIEIVVGGGVEIPVELSSRRVGNDPRLLFRTAIVDQTERRRAEQILRKTNDALERRTAEAELRAEQLRTLAAALTEAEHKERRRIAHILHEDVQQLLAAAKLHIGVADDMRDSAEKVHERLAKSKELVAQAIEVSRSLAVDLGAAPLSSGLPTALRWLAGRMAERHNLTVDVDVVQGADAVQDGARVVVFDAVRELLFNVIKHASVDRARVVVEKVNGGGLAVTVEDQGKGFEVGHKTEVAFDHFGLAAVRQRMEWIGGRLDVTSSPGQGTRATLVLPTQ